MRLRWCRLARKRRSDGWPYAALLLALSGSPAPVLGQVDPLADPAVPELARRPIARIGGLDERPEYALTEVDGVAILPDRGLL